MIHRSASLPFLLTLSLLSAPGSRTLAQRSFGGTPFGLWEVPLHLPGAPVVTFPAVDAVAMLQADADRLAQGIKGPARFGVEHPAAIDLRTHGVWAQGPRGERIWRVTIECPGAMGIGITFTHHVVPPEGRVFIYNAEREVLGAFNAQSHPGHEVLGVQPLRGSLVTVEYVEPPDHAGEGELTIGQVVHVYRSPWKGFDRDLGDSGPCNINTICPEGDDWRPEIRSVALILAGGGSCTGQLLNNCNNDSTPYFLTANHCLGTDPSTWVFRFLWESPSCDPTENGPTNNTISGSTQLVANPASDMLFLQLDEQPPPSFDAYYNGWDKSGVAPTSATCIHHPSGDIKKISHDLQGQDQVNIDVGNGPADCWHVAAWDAGTTEPGSSGSGLWDQNHRIVGQLYGGQASCANNVNDYFGRFDVSYPLLEQWLGSCGDTLNGLDPGYTEPVVQHNAAITSIVNVDRLLCNVDTISPIVTLKNNGAAVLQTVTIDHEVLGGTTGSLLWEGFLAPLQTANVQLPPIPITGGEQTLVVSTSLPNGQADGGPQDDSDTLDFIANLPGTAVDLLLTPDAYGEDITWALYNQSGILLYQGGPYANGSTATIERSFCLGDGCYTFEINDVFGDGICCSEGDGHYVITSGFGDLVVSNGQYGQGEVRTFCLDGVGMAEASADITVQAWPNPANEQVMVNWPAGATEWSLLDVCGRPVRSGSRAPVPALLRLDVSDLAAGHYLLNLRQRNAPTTSVRVLVQH